MRFAITVDPEIPVPPLHYGGIERIVDFVVHGLVDSGHQVTLFAHPDSKANCQVVGYGVPPHRGFAPRAKELQQLSVALWKRRKDFDAVLSWGRLAALIPVLPYRDLLKIQFYCRDYVPWRSVRIAARLAGDSIQFSGSSASVYDGLEKQNGRGGNWHTMYYGVSLTKYPFVSTVPEDAPLVFLGRIERIKGTHTAIAIARSAGRRLTIAGNRVDNAEGKHYFTEEIAPEIDGDQVKYVGPVNDDQKAQLLGGAAALLFPIEWREAFGIVMAESLACGTPVIGFPYGSVPEVVRDGVNGFICRDVSEAVEAVGKLAQLSRAKVRKDCEQRFSSEVIVDQIVARADEFRQRTRRRAEGARACEVKGT